MAKARIVIAESEIEPFKIKNGRLTIKPKHLEEGIEKLFGLAGKLQTIIPDAKEIEKHSDDAIAAAVDRLKSTEPSPN